MSLNFERTKQRMKTGVSSDGRQSRTYILAYHCSSDSATELSVSDVLSALGLRVGSGFSEDQNATLQDVEIDRLSSVPPHCAWEVVLTFATNAKVPENDSDDPTQQRVKRSKRFSEVARYIVKDRQGTLIVNAANDPFSEGVAVTDFPHSFVYEWSRSIPTRGFHKTINAHTFNGCPPGTLLCLISSTEEFEGSYSYWRETIEMRNNPDGWQPSPLNAGLAELVYVAPFNLDTVKKIPCVDAHQQPCAEPQPLYDGTAKLPDDTPDLTKRKGTMIPVAQRPDDCVFVDVDHYVESLFEHIGVREFPE